MQSVASQRNTADATSGDESIRVHIRSHGAATKHRGYHNLASSYTTLAEGTDAIPHREARMSGAGSQRLEPRSSLGAPAQYMWFSMVSGVAAGVVAIAAVAIVEMATVLVSFLSVELLKGYAEV